jgi:alpha-galactosidase
MFAWIIILSYFHRKVKYMNIQIGNLTISISSNDCRPVKGGYAATCVTLDINLSRPPKNFYRHGWQSWTLTTWVNPNQPMTPISAHQTRAKDEDFPYAFSAHPVSAWIGALEMDDGMVILLGCLDLSGRVEITGTTMRGFYEDGHSGNWLIAIGGELEVFNHYSNLLGNNYGTIKNKAPRVWCSWYSLYNTINEPVIDGIIEGLGELPFDVLQLDDGWQISLGKWDANKKFPFGMKVVANKIRATGRQAGLWLSPFITPRNSEFAREHPDWILRHENGNPVYAGVGWSGELNALDSSHLGVLNWLGETISKVVDWGYTYLKLDFLYAAALPGMRAQNNPRETAFRDAMHVIRKAAGSDTYLLACGSPVFPVLGICNGIRIGPDVAPFWLSRPLSVWVNNPNNPGTQNGLRTSLHRLWLRDLIHLDPDVAYFRSRHNQMTSEQRQLLQDLVNISQFKATSDLPQWLKTEERERLNTFLEEQSKIEQLSRYRFSIDGRIVDFSSFIPLPQPVKFPSSLAFSIGIAQMGWQELLPGLIESTKADINSRVRRIFSMTTKVKFH